MKYKILGELGDWTFYQVDNHGFKGGSDGKPLFAFTVTAEETMDRTEKPRFGELYPTLGHAMVSAVGEKYTGPRGAGGTGVGTAANWFMAMIGAYDTVKVAEQDGTVALREVIREINSDGGVVTGHAVERRLSDRGLFLAREVIR